MEYVSSLVEQGRLPPKFVLDAVPIGKTCCFVLASLVFLFVLG
jgi:hypothetical protein